MNTVCTISNPLQSAPCFIVTCSVGHFLFGSLPALLSTASSTSVVLMHCEFDNQIKPLRISNVLFKYQYASEFPVAASQHRFCSLFYRPISTSQVCSKPPASFIQLLSFPSQHLTVSPCRKLSSALWNKNCATPGINPGSYLPPVPIATYTQYFENRCARVKADY